MLVFTVKGLGFRGALNLLTSPVSDDYTWTRVAP